VAVVGLNLIPAAVLVRQHWSAADIALGFGVAAAGIAFSLVFANWINGIIHQSNERAQLIGQLEATRAELAVVHRQAGVLAERQRLSLEIHDTIAQGFASIVMLLQAAEAGLDGDPARADYDGADSNGARHHLALATTTARENLAEARALVAGLAPTQFDEGGSLDDALRRVTTQVRQGGIATDVEITGTARPLGTGAEVMLLRVCQEALSNVRKHASASRAVVALAYDQSQVRLEVSDDGCGFDPAATRPGGYGLRGMQARVAEAGGTLEVASAPGTGTAVTVTVQV
jgi:signal transduction histidine kinase